MRNENLNDKIINHQTIQESYHTGYRNSKLRSYYPIMILIFSILCVTAVIMTVSIFYSNLSDRSFYEIVPNVAKLFMAYFAIGAILKFVDDAYDENRFPKTLAIFAIILSFVIAVNLAMIDGPTAVIFLALVVGVTAMGKTLIPPFFIGTVAYIGSYFILDIFNGFNWYLFAVILIALFADELGAEWAKNIIKRNSTGFMDSGKSRFMVYFLRDRNIGLSILLFLVLIGWLPLLNWLAWFFLDFGYIIIEGISLRENLTKILSRQVFSKSLQPNINRS